MNIREYIEDRSIPEPNSGCWLWLDPVNPGGYGRAYWEGEREKAHRLSWKAHRDPIPTGMCVCHKCDVRSCVNPDHLWLGTRGDNNSDRSEKGRSKSANGSAHPKSRLTEEQVLAIRASSVGGDTLARQYGVSKVLISRIRNRKTWRHV